MSIFLNDSITVILNSSEQVKLKSLSPAIAGRDAIPLATIDGFLFFCQSLCKRKWSRLLSLFSIISGVSRVERKRDKIRMATHSLFLPGSDNQGRLCDRIVFRAFEQSGRTL